MDRLLGRISVRVDGRVPDQAVDVPAAAGVVPVFRKRGQKVDGVDSGNFNVREGLGKREFGWFTFLHVGIESIGPIAPQPLSAS